MHPPAVAAAKARTSAATKTTVLNRRFRIRSSSPNAASRAANSVKQNSQRLLHRNRLKGGTQSYKTFSKGVCLPSASANVRRHIRHSSRTGRLLSRRPKTAPYASMASPAKLTKGIISQ